MKYTIRNRDNIDATIWDMLIDWLKYSSIEFSNMILVELVRYRFLVVGYIFITTWR